LQLRILLSCFRKCVFLLIFDDFQLILKRMIVGIIEIRMSLSIIISQGTLDQVQLLRVAMV
jgi:hypothetical protein